jgi:hypothetical protein
MKNYFAIDEFGNFVHFPNNAVNTVGYKDFFNQRAITKYWRINISNRDEVLAMIFEASIEVVDLSNIKALNLRKFRYKEDDFKEILSAYEIKLIKLKNGYLAHRRFHSYEDTNKLIAAIHVVRKSKKPEIYARRKIIT